MRRRYAIPLLAVVGALAVLALACGDDDAGAAPGPAAGPGGLDAASLQAQAGAVSEGITVSAQGIATAEPDTGLLSLGVSVLSGTAREARDGAAQAMDSLLTSLRGNGIADEDIKTAQFSLNPEYDYSSSGSPRLTGYRLTHVLSVKTHDLERAAEVIDGAVDAVGDPIQVSGISFTLDDPAAVQSQARSEAMAKAQAKAQELATLAGVTLSAPLSITESSSDGGSPVNYDLRAEGAQSLPATSSIQAGQLDVVVSVQVTYAIE